MKNPLEGYRRLTFMMLDADIVAVSPTSVWRVLGQAIDVSYINISGTFYYLCSILDGCSRYIVNWDLRESMTETVIEIHHLGARQGTAPGSAAPDHFR